MTALTLTPDSTTASVLLQITGAPQDISQPLVEQRRNLVPNPNAEVDAANWSVTLGTLTRDTTTSFFGAASLKYVTTTAGATLSSAEVSVVGNTKYTMSAYYSAAALAGDVKIGAIWYDSSHAQITNGVSSANTTTGAWTRMSITVTSPASAVYGRLIFFVNSTGTTTLNLDGLMMEKAAALADYFDGSFTTPDGYTAYAWTGSPNASASTYAVRAGADGPVAITRVDANGSRSVRMLSGQRSSSGILTVRDYEAALTGTIRYDVKDGAGVTISGTTWLLGVTSPVLHVPVLPQYRWMLTGPGLTGYESQRDSSSTIHEVIGRADPLVTTGPLNYRRGTMTFYAASHSDARSIEALAARGEVLMLRQPDHVGMDQYFVTEDVRITPDQLTANGWIFSVDISYVEVRVPTGPLLGSVGWVLASIASAFATFADVPSVYPTLADLTVGPS